MNPNWPSSTRSTGSTDSTKLISITTRRTGQTGDPWRLATSDGQSLTEREKLRGKVQMIYIDPPYGIKFSCNWQVFARKRDVKDGN